MRALRRPVLDCLFVFVIASLLLAAPAIVMAAPPPIPSGTIVFVRGPSGFNLSARPDQTVVMSSNSSAWEQWEFHVEPNSLGPIIRLLSYHGTTLILSGTTPVAAPFGVDYDATNINAAADGRVAISVAMPGGNGTSYHLLEDQSGTPVVYSDNSQGYPFHEVWTLVPVTSPASGRHPETFGVVSKMAIRTSQGTFIQEGPQETVKAADGSSRFAHASKQGASPWPFIIGPPGDARGLATAIHFGDTVWIYDLYPFAMSPDVNFMIWCFGSWSASSANYNWIIVDPTHSFAPNARVGFGYQVGIQNKSTHLYLSLDPTKSQATLSPNLSGWETFTFVPAP